MHSPFGFVHLTHQNLSARALFCLNSLAKVNTQLLIYKYLITASIWRWWCSWAFNSPIDFFNVTTNHMLLNKMYWVYKMSLMNRKRQWWHQWNVCWCFFFSQHQYFLFAYYLQNGRRGGTLSPAEHNVTKVWSHAKVCAVKVPFKLSCLLNVHSSKTGKIPVEGKQYNILRIPKNRLHLLISFVQNSTSTFSV